MMGDPLCKRRAGIRVRCFLEGRLELGLRSLRFSPKGRQFSFRIGKGVVPSAHSGARPCALLSQLSTGAMREPPAPRLPRPAFKEAER
jgi:hypothetical protein